MSTKPAPSRRRWVRRLRRQRSLLFGLVLLPLTIAVLVSTLWLPLPNPTDQDIMERLLPLGVSSAHLLGTDHLGRDVLSQLLSGARLSFTLSAAAALVSGLIGIPLGLYAGYSGGRIGTAIMRVADVQFAFPFIVLAIAILASAGASLLTVGITLILWNWVSFARVARAETLVIREMEYVEAVRAMGGSSSRILLRHVLPNALPPLIVIGTLSLGQMILAESALSFLGMGVPPPQTTLGGMLADGRGYMTTAWWLVAIPGAAIMLVVLATNLIGDGLRDLLDPRLRSTL